MKIVTEAQDSMLATCPPELGLVMLNVSLANMEGELDKTFYFCLYFVFMLLSQTLSNL